MMTVSFFCVSHEPFCKQMTLNNQAETPLFKIFTEVQADNLIENDRQLCSLAKMGNPDKFQGENNQLTKIFLQKIQTPTKWPPPG